MKKVFSWLRSKGLAADKPSTFADAWRLDLSVPFPGDSAPAAPRPAPSRPANPPRPVRPRRPAPPRPAPEARNATPVPPPKEIEPVPAPHEPGADAPDAREQVPAQAPVAPEARLLRELRMIFERRPLDETAPASDESRPDESRFARELRAPPTPAPEPVRSASPAQPKSAQPKIAQPKPVQSTAQREEPRGIVQRFPSKPRALLQEGTLAAAGLIKAYGARRVVNDVTIGLRRGEAVGLLGPNGAGKTTVFYMIVGLIAADAGRILLDGFDVTGLPMYRRARLGIGYLPQEPSIFRGLTVEDNIRAVLEVVEPDRVMREESLESLLAEFNVERVRRSPSIALSGGERRRVEIARALATRPSFMLLDEPFAGIDPIAVGDIQELVRHLTRRGIGVLITDHNVRETLGLVDRAYIVHSGQILMEGGPDEIVESEDVRRLYLGEEFRL